ncbi:MAG: hypothetical protein ACYTG7_03450 [Planctomycetota bacterium]
MRSSEHSFKPIQPLAAVFFALIMPLAHQVLGDAIVISRAMKASTIAEIFIEEEGVRVEIEIGLKDLAAFRNLMPDEIYEKMGYEAEPFEERLQKFFKSGLLIKGEGGETLPGRLVRIVPRERILRDEITGEPLPNQPEEGELTIVVEMHFAFQGHPARLALKPPMEDETGFTSVDIGFVAFHLDLPVNDFRYLATEEVIDLDWDDPWYSTFRNRNLKRQYNAPMSGFLYIDPFEVRKEIVLRPKDLQHWIDLGLEGKKVIPAEEQADLKQRIAEFLATRNPVTVDGKEVELKLDRIHFIRRTLRTTGVIDPPEDLPITSATLGAIFIHPIDRLPQKATMTWELFSPRIQKVPTAATDEAGGMPWTVTPEDPVLEWQNFLKNPTIPGLVDVAPPEAAKLPIPLLSIACGVVLLGLVVRSKRTGAPSGSIYALGFLLILCIVILWPFARMTVPSPLGGTAGLAEEKSRSVMKSLLKNVYHAFDYRDEGIIYDTLARSASGDLLTKIYLETRRSLELENQGGARARVKEVEVLDSETSDLEEGAGFQSELTWNVMGSVGHWGHIHMRKNQYVALFTVRPEQGMWKISKLELLSEERL